MLILVIHPYDVGFSVPSQLVVRCRLAKRRCVSGLLSMSPHQVGDRIRMRDLGTGCHRIFTVQKINILTTEARLSTDRSEFAPHPLQCSKRLLW